MTRPPLRSSIACLRCRRSKIKCDNDGGTAPCETCIKGGHKCQYPDVAAPPTRRSDPNVVKQERDSAPEKKRKRMDDISGWVTQRSAAYAEEVLSYPFLRGELWDQVFTIYKLHFSTELPFLHMATLKEKIDLKQKGHLETDHDVNLVLLGVLTLTARFHADLVKYVAAISSFGSSRSRPTSGKVDPNSASEFYATALATALGSLPGAIARVSVERVQAFLMLGLYEWTRNRPQAGVRAWMYVGTAIRMAQALRLGYGDKPGQSTGSARGRSGPSGPSKVSPSDWIIEKETRRRTMFSCLILDRLLAVGDDRASMISTSDLHIQLPCSEVAFDLASEVYTGFLNEGDEVQPRDPKFPSDDSVLSRFVKLVDLWGEITRYSFSGGRATESGHRPWDENSTFRKLRRRLDDFYASLPETFTLSTKNFFRHDNHQATSMYVSLHMLGSVCQIMIHREYIPFIPIRCERPSGPLDPPLIVDEGPAGFWMESAEHVFRSARDIVELIGLAGDKLPQSSLVLFAIWTSAFCGLYAIHFPHMDTEGYMSESGDVESQREAIRDMTKESATGTTYHALEKLSSYLPLASTYIKIFGDCDRYFAQVTNDFHKREGKNNGRDHTAGRRAGGRGGVEGGGGREWRTHKGKITSNGNIFPSEDDRNATREGSDTSHTRSPDRDGPSVAEPHYNSSSSSGSHRDGSGNGAGTGTGTGGNMAIPTTPSLASASPRPANASLSSATISPVAFTPINSGATSHHGPAPSEETSPHIDGTYRAPQIAQEALLRSQYYSMDPPPALHNTFEAPHEVSPDGAHYPSDPASYLEHESDRISAVQGEMFGPEELTYSFALFQPPVWDSQYFEEKGQHAPEMFMSASAIGHPA
ncbi:uncharacterized protein DNG_08514 [Cephalotrichum gorgonifer]|uniref:Zn(2)-C6 fungal-type domain-containing protein n=1 Tax=Cephalotrichum gorgonifer TaxID=2041049 RepID=A0AAE8N4G1_9PEZI|nr:uncharacterized protein DNG_08514 [Cephalotrichum gorgonifer]